MKTLILVCLMFLAVTAFSAQKPKAPHGFKWKAYKDAYCEIQVPNGWFEARRTAGVTRVVLLSPDKIEEGKGIGTGFTMNTVKCSTQAEWTEAMQLVGKMMSENRKATEHPVASHIEENEDMLLMVIEGERLIANAPHPEKKYHVRTIVRAFPKFSTIYMYSFGAPVENWDEEWKKGTVMLGPVFFTLHE